MQNEGKGFIYFPILNYADGNLNFLEALQRSRRLRQFAVRWRRALRHDLRCGFADLHAAALGARPRRQTHHA
jgi:hypothetical protein